MQYRLPFDYADLLSEPARKDLRAIVAPLESAVPGDIVGIVVDMQIGKTGGLIESPIRSVVQRTTDSPNRAGHFHKSFFVHFSPEDQAKLALPLKLFEASRSLRLHELSRIANQFISGMLSDTIQLVLTNEVAVLYHQYAQHWISTRRISDPLQDSDLKGFLRVLLPSDLSAHATVEMMSNMGEVIELVQSLDLFPSDRQVELVAPDLRVPVTPD